METKTTGARDPLSAFERLVDDIKVKVRLGRMDVKDAWESLQPDITDFRKALAASIPRRTKAGTKKARSVARMAVDEVELQAHLAAMEAAERWEPIERRLSPIIEHLKRGGAALGAMVTMTEEEGAQRRIDREKRREAAAKDFGQAREEVAAAARDARMTLLAAIDSLRDRLARVTSEAEERPEA